MIVRIKTCFVFFIFAGLMFGQSDHRNYKNPDSVADKLLKPYFHGKDSIQLSNAIKSSTKDYIVLRENHKIGVDTLNHFLLKLSHQLSENSKFNKANNVSLLAIKINEYLGSDLETYFFYYITLAENFIALKLLDSAAVYLEKINKMAGSSIYKKHENVILNITANLLYAQGKYLLSLDSYHKALENYTLSKDVNNVAVIEQNIGSIYLQLKNYDRAKYYFFKSLEKIEKSDELDKKKAIYNFLGITYKAIDSFEKAEKYYNKNRELAVLLDNDYSLAQIYTNLANVKRKQKMYAEAEQYIDSSMQIAKKNNLEIGYLINGINLAEIFLEQSEFKKAQDALDNIKGLQVKFNIPEFSLEINRLYSFIYTHMNDIEKELYHFKKYVNAKDSLNGIEVNRLLNDYELTFIERNKAKELQQVENKLVKSKLISQFSIVIIVLILSIILLLIVNHRKSKKNQQLEIIKAQKIIQTKEIKEVELYSNLNKTTIELNDAINSIKKVTLLKKQLGTILLAVKKGNQDQEGVIKQIKICVNSFFDTYSGITENVENELNIERIISAIRAEYPEINKKEIKVIEYIVFQFTTKEIAILLDKSEKSIEYYRSQIRKKLDVDSTDTLENFLTSLK